MKTLWLLMAEFNSPTITLEQACKSMGITEKTGQNKLSEGTFPIPTFKMMDGKRQKRFVHVNDLANYIDKLRDQATLDFKHNVA